ncbi:MAG: asparaginase [Clostridium sp.]
MKTQKKNLKRILMIATGGTIASKRSAEGLKPLMTSEELLGFVPHVKEFCEVTAMQVINIDSTNIQPKHWLLISSTIERLYDQYDGFVVCHGTDTLAYTASALSYLIQNSPKPIVITGAQKPIDLEITDAKTNLSDSFLFASCDKAHGVNIVFDGKVIAGTRGKKERTKSYNAFSSINFPYIATIQDSNIIFYLDDKDQVQRGCNLLPQAGQQR